MKQHNFKLHRTSGNICYTKNTSYNDKHIYVQVLHRSNCLCYASDAKSYGNFNLKSAENKKNI